MQPESPTKNPLKYMQEKKKGISVGVVGAEGAKPPRISCEGCEEQIRAAPEAGGTEKQGKGDCRSTHRNPREWGLLARHPGSLLIKDCKMAEPEAPLPYFSDV